MCNKEIMPDGQYYDNPYPMSSEERDSYSQIPLLPGEALHILVNSVGKRIGNLDKLALREIADSDEDYPLDFKEVRQKIARELEMEDDDY